MERLILLAALVSPLAGASSLSTPIIGTAGPETLTPTSKPAIATTPVKPAPQQPVNSVSTPASAGLPAAGTTTTPSNPYGTPPSLTPQRQINQLAAGTSQPPASSVPANTAPMTVYTYDGSHPKGTPNSTSPGLATAQEPATAAPKRKKLVYRSKVEGRPLYRIQIYQPRTILTLYNGVCLAENRHELRQQLIDEGIDTRKRTYLHPVVASLPTGRMEGCWYYDRKQKYFRVRLENGQGEDFSREQVDK